MSGLEERRVIQSRVRGQRSERPPMPDVYMPATWPVGWLAMLRGWVAAWYRRRQFLRLQDLDDRTLRDIGISRDDIRWGARQPLRVNAAREIQARLRQRQVHKATTGEFRCSRRNE